MSLRTIAVSDHMDQGTSVGALREWYEGPSVGWKETLGVNDSLVFNPVIVVFLDSKTGLFEAGTDWLQCVENPVIVCLVPVSWQLFVLKASIRSRSR